MSRTELQRRLIADGMSEADATKAIDEQPRPAWLVEYAKDTPSSSGRALTTHDCAETAVATIGRELGAVIGGHMAAAAILDLLQWIDNSRTAEVAQMKAHLLLRTALGANDEPKSAAAHRFKWSRQRLNRYHKELKQVLQTIEGDQRSMFTLGAE